MTSMGNCFGIHKNFAIILADFTVNRQTFIISDIRIDGGRRLGGGFLRRCRFEIMGEILSIAADGVRKTTIVYRANLNFNVVNRYLDLLIREGLINAAAGSEMKFKTTEQGLGFLKAYKNLKGTTKNL